MFKTNLKTAWRNFLRNRVLSTIRIAGLSIGLTVCMLILLYTKDETSFDRFHENKDMLFRVVQSMQVGKDAPNMLGVTQPALAPTFGKNIPEIAQFVRTNQIPVTIKINNEVFPENPFIADSNFFQVFSFPLLKGDPATALDDIHSMVLSEDMAKKYFGTTDAIGKILQVKRGDEFENFSVSAIAKNSPQNSTIRFDILLPFSYYQKNNQYDGWIGGSVNTFLLLKPNVNAKLVDNKMQQIFNERTKEQIEEAKREQGLTVSIKINLQPLAEIHLGSIDQGNGLEEGSSITYSYILSSIAIFILIVACINFITLAVAQSLKRSKEIGIRKVIGGTRKQLIKQFLVEAFLYSCISFAIALVLTSVLLPVFNDMSNKRLSMSYLADYKLYIGYFLLLLLTSLVAGFYPSLIMSAFRPVKVLYSRQKLMSKNYFTRGLIVLQFTLAVFLIIATIAIHRQINFVYSADLGYNTENLIRIDMPFGGRKNDKVLETFKHEMASDRSVITIAGRNGGVMISGVRANGKDIEIDYNRIDDRFFSALQIPLKQGRNFSSDFPSDISQSVIVNESFVKKAGWEDPIGRRISFLDDKKEMTVVGVVRDYHFRSLKVEIAPQVFAIDTSYASYGQLFAKISSKDIPGTVSSLEKEFKKLTPFFPFRYQFVKDITAYSYREEVRWKQIISIASALFIFISCIGLFGLVMLSVEQRAKEIGIRKILGAAVSRIVILISKEFVILIGIAFVIAAPAGYYAINKWLQNFAYRIDISWWMFVVAGLFVIGIALLTLSFRAVKAALANPVKNLRTE